MRLTLLLSALILLISAMARPVSVRGQESDLTSYLPDRDKLPSDMVVVDQGTRTLDKVANTFADPATAKQHLESWGWQENVVLELAPKDPSSAQTTQLQFSLHRFETDTGAAEAMDYFVTERAAALGLQEANPTAPAADFRVIRGEVDGEYESTVYAQAGPIIVRVTLRKPSTAQTGPAFDSAPDYARDILDAIEGFGHYISPQFGYEIEWQNRVWPQAESSSIPGVRDELLLSSDDATLLYRGEVVAPNASPSPDAVPLPGGRGVITRKAEHRGGWAGPLPPGIVSENWAAAADDLPPQAPPFGLNALPSEGLTADRLGQAAPQTAGRLHLTSSGATGPVGHWNTWVLRGGPTVTYNDPGDAAVPDAELLVDDVTSTVTANEAIRYLFNLGFLAGGFAERGIVGADVRLDAPIPYILTGNPEVGYQLLFGTRNGNWVVTVRGRTIEDIEALVRALITGLAALTTDEIATATNPG